jgi:hypothetical protein
VGKLIVWNVISLDGYFEGDEAWDLKLHEHIWGSELRELSLSFGDELGLLVFGRATYEGMAAYWQNDPDEAEIAVYMNAAHDSDFRDRVLRVVAHPSVAWVPVRRVGVVLVSDESHAVAGG